MLFKLCGSKWRKCRKIVPDHAMDLVCKHCDGYFKVVRQSISRNDEQQCILSNRKKEAT